MFPGHAAAVGWPRAQEAKAHFYQQDLLFHTQAVTSELTPANNPTKHQEPWSLLMPGSVCTEHQ